ncbi:MAG: S1 RNA-binding domain-containing protein [Coprobacillus sp.]|nr:S1 RNA-binding domain-containing protein [Coprobacillus sp.]
MVNEVKVGDVIKATITEIRPYGAFFKMEKTSGLIHISELDDGYIPDIHTIIDVGDSATIKVIGLEANGFLHGSLKQVPSEEREIIHNIQEEKERKEKDFRVLKNRLPKWIDEKLKEIEKNEQH